ncbi:MAG: LPS assembly lipoprotein LptE [Myxococcota bacterium]|nr:LPS assembly lipoprotein LptE [Myxococcota bacterium]
MRRAALLPLLGLACVAVMGCAYSLVRYQGGLGDVRSVAVDTPSNDSSEPGLEFVVADALRRELLRRRAARVVEDPNTADLVLSGRVKGLSARGRSFSSVTLAVEYEFTLTLDLVASRPDGSKVPIDSRSLRETERYLASADVEAQRKNRLEAVRHVANVLAGRVVDTLQETLRP